jgi:hypothetical protein
VEERHLKRTRKKLLLILTSFLLVVFLNNLVGNNIVKAPIEVYSITINNGNATTNSLDVTLTLSSGTQDPHNPIVSMRFTNNDPSITEDWSAWRTYSLTSTWQLLPGLGIKTVTAQNKLQNGTLTEYFSDNIEVDTTPPEGTVVIENGDPYTSSQLVTLTLSANDDSSVEQMSFRNDGSTWTAWESYATLKSWTMTESEGTKVVHAQFKDDVGLITEASDTIILDATPPKGSILINGGDAYTTSTSVTLQLTYDDETSGVDKVRYTNAYEWGSEPWQNPVESMSWTLTAEDGAKYVSYEIRDKAGLISETYWDQIYLDATPPTGSILINGGDAYTTSTSVTLQLFYYDPASGVSLVRYSNDGIWDTEPWEGASSSRSWSLTAGDGAKTVYFQIKDAAGNLMTFSDDITLKSSTATETQYFNVPFEEDTYVIETCSNSTISDLTFNQALKRVRFDVDGTTGTTGFCNITIPAELLSGDFTVFMDDAQMIQGVDYTDTLNGTNHTLSITYAHSTHIIEIVGTNVIPDFTSWLLLPFLIAATLLVFALKKTRKATKKIP